MQEYRVYVLPETIFSYLMWPAEAKSLNTQASKFTYKKNRLLLIFPNKNSDFCKKLNKNIDFEGPCKKFLKNGSFAGLYEPLYKYLLNINET